MREIDCQAKTIRNLEVYAKLDEAMIGSGTVNYAFVAIEPGSTSDTDLRSVCHNDWPR